MSTLEDLANAIDKAAEGTALSRDAIQSAIVAGISRLTGLSVQEIYSANGVAYFEDLATGLHHSLVLKLEQKFLDKIIASITPGKSIVVTAGVPVGQR